MNGRNILKMAGNGKKFPDSEVGKDGRTLVKLKEALIDQAKRRYAIFKDAPDLSILPPGKILIQADHTLPFGTLKYLLHTAAVSSYRDYRFARFAAVSQNSKSY